MYYYLSNYNTGFYLSCGRVTNGKAEIALTENMIENDRSYMWELDKVDTKSDTNLCLIKNLGSGLYIAIESNLFFTKDNLFYTPVTTADKDTLSPARLLISPITKNYSANIYSYNQSEILTIDIDNDNKPGIYLMTYNFTPERAVWNLTPV